MHRDTILIVEDEVILAMDIKSRLETAGYKVCATATSGREALEKAETYSPGLILMDIQIRGDLDGIETARRILDRMDVPIVFLTAFSDDDTIQRAKDCEPYGYILKPFEERELLISVEMALYKFKTEMALRESEERYMLAIRGANDGIWDWDMRKNEIYFAPRWKEMLGFDTHEMGHCPEEWFQRIHPDDLESFRLAISSHLSGLEEFFETEHRIKTRSGDYIWVLTRGLALLDRNGVPYRMSGSQTDITRRKKAEEQIVHNALHDALTGLPNRALVLERLGRAIERFRRYRQSYALLFIDLDRFKIINDSLGHMTGDALLVAVARRLEKTVHSFDTIARLGGDEFVVLLENIESTDHVQQIADRVIDSFKKPFEIDGHLINISASIGIVSGYEDYGSALEVLRDADLAMYRAKSNGKARAELFNPRLRAWMIDSLNLENQLRGALERDEFELYYQPICTIDEKAMVGFEALLRWRPTGCGMVPPKDFIAMAEESGLIHSIGEWVIRKACAQMRRWQIEHPESSDLFISINLSGRQITAPDLADKVSAILAETGLAPYSLQLEITENVVIENSEQVLETLTRLTKCGVRIAIDDFGIGYSSLSYLQHFPIRTLKIDRSFISMLDAGKNHNEIVRMIIKMASELNLVTIAEGVETDEQWSLLEKMSCPWVQGFLYSIPLNADSAEAFLVESNGGNAQPTKI